MQSSLLKKISKVSLSLQKKILQKGILQKRDLSFAKILLLKCASYLGDRLTGNNNCEYIRAVQRNGEEAPKILFIDDRMPYDFLGAGYPRSRVILNILSKLKVNASFIPLGFACNDSPSMIHSHFPDNIDYLLSLNKDSIFSFLYKKRNFFDAIIISRPHNMEYLYGVLKYLKRYKPSLKIIYDAEALICYREILKQETLGQPFSTEKQKMLIDQEKALFSVADSIYAVSPSEKKLIQNYYPDTPISVISHCVESHQPINGFHKRENFLFIGRLNENDSPNVDSLIWFCQEIWPSIRKQLPQAKLDIVGLAEASQLKPLKNQDDINFHGRQDCLDEFYAAAKVFIAPTRFAAGIPLKVCGAASHGIPIVMTEVLLTQLDWPKYSSLGVHWQQSSQFTQTCVKIYNDEEYWNEMSQQGLEYINTQYTKEQMYRSFVTSLEQLNLL